MKGIFCLHVGYPLEFDPICKTSQQEYELACDLLNQQGIFIETNFLINEALFSFLVQNNYQICKEEKCISQEQALQGLDRLVKSLAEFIVILDAEDKDEAKRWAEIAFDDFDRYRTVADYVNFIVLVDKYLMPVFPRILEIEIQAHRNNSFVL